MTSELCFQPASVLREAIAARKVSPVELTDAVLARATALQPTLNCFITLVPEQARAAARAAEDAVMRGDPLGLLHGIPFAAKDLVNTAGVRTTFGSLHAPAPSSSARRRRRSSARSPSPNRRCTA